MEKTYDIEYFDHASFLEEAREKNSQMADKVYACIPKDGKVTLYLKEFLTEDEEVEMQEVIDAHDATPLPDLRVFRVLPKDMNPLISDFTILGFRKESPSYERGRKTEALYKCTDKDEIIVRKTFSDERDENGVLTGVIVKFDWFREDGTIGATKTEVVRKYNKYEAETEERKRRERQIDYLVAGAKGTPIESSLELVFNKYYDQVLKYEVQGVSKDLSDALDAEDDTTMLFVLNDVPLPRKDDPTKTITVKQSIKYQIGVLTLEQVENGES